MEIAAELRPMLRLAAPLAASELGWMAMGIADTMMVARVSDAAVGAVSIGGTLFYTVGIFGTGLMLGLDTLVSQAFGAGDREDCHRSLIGALYFAAPLAPALMAVVWTFAPLLRLCGINPEVLRETGPYLNALVWSTPPLILYFALRRYLQGINQVRPIVFALVTANLVNIACNWILDYGNLGAPAMGAVGAGWSTTVARLYMAGVLGGYIIWNESGDRHGLFAARWRVDLARIAQLLRLGLPAALQILVEIGVFAAATTLAGRLEPASLAAHQIALTVVSATFMVVLGISSAAAVRVGQAIGQGDPAAAARSGWTALGLGVVFMSLAALTLLLIPGLILQAYTPDPRVIRIGTTLLAVGAAWQIFDGLQGVATGALRGAGDTRTPMIWHLGAYWLIGLPLGYYLCFGRGWGVAGLWTGLCLALTIIGTALVVAWRRTAVRAVATLAIA